MISRWSIPLFESSWSSTDIEYIAKVIRRGTHWACGPEIAKFEEKLALFNGRRFALTFNSGTSALHAMYHAYNLSGKEVIVPSFCFVATANAALLAGAKTVFADSESETFGLDAESVRQAITPRTGAIVAFHYSGCPSRDIIALKQIAEEHKILLLEDNY